MQETFTIIEKKIGFMGLPKDTIRKILESFEDEISRLDLCDHGSAEFLINRNNEIELLSMDLQTDRLIEVLYNILQEFNINSKINK